MTETQRALRHLLIIRLTAFGKLNQQLGAAAGDRVLRKHFHDTGEALFEAAEALAIPKEPAK